MKNNKILIAAASLCLLFTSLSVNVCADETAAADNSSIVKSPDTVGDKGISAAFIGAGISALAILICKKCKSYTDH